jgi:hypothetical protein
MWFSHDDVLAPRYLERCVAVLEADPSAVLCFSAYSDIDANGRVLGTRRARAAMDASDPVVRFRQGIRLDHRCEPWCGVTRSQVLARTPLYGSFADYDRVVIAELALLGRLVEISEPLFFCREHVNRSHLVYASRFERTRWLDPRNARAIVFPHFRQLRAFWGAVRRSNLQWSAQMRCAWALLGWVGAYRRRLVTDLAVVALELLRPIVRRLRPAPRAAP